MALTVKLHGHCQVPSCLKMCISESLAAEVSTIYAFVFFVHPLFELSVFTKFAMCNAVSEGVASLIQGSYEYYHYLQDGFDDSVYLFSFFHVFKTLSMQPDTS